MSSRKKFPKMSFINRIFLNESKKSHNKKLKEIYNKKVNLSCIHKDIKENKKKLSFRKLSKLKNDNYFYNYDKKVNNKVLFNNIYNIEFGKIVN